MVAITRITFFTLLSCMLLHLAYAQKNNDLFQEIQRYEELGSYEKILNKLDDVKWSSVREPELIMAYCIALVEKRRGFPENLAHDNQINGMPDFARAMYELINGDAASSKKILDILILYPHSRTWGIIGQLYFADHTENYPLMGKWLQQLEDTKNHQLNLKRFIRVFQCKYLYHIGQYDELEAFIDKGWNDVSILPYKSALYIRENNISHAYSFLKNALSLHGDLKSLVLAMADILYIKDGPKKALQYLDEKFKGNANLWELKKAYAEYSLSLENESAVDQSLKVMRQLSANRHFDIPLLCKAMLLHFWYSKNDEAVGVLRNSGLKSLPSMYTSSLLISAFIHYHSGDVDAMWNALSQARTQAPTSQFVLGFFVKAAMNEGKWKEAIQATKLMLKRDPYDPIMLLELAKLYANKQMWKEVLFVTEKASISTSTRYMDREINQRISELANRAVLSRPAVRKGDGG